MILQEFGFFFLKFKHEVVGVFMKFKKMVETQSGYKIQFLRSNNGKEYTSTKFNLFCEKAGIAHQLTAPYTPQQNGVNERRNRSVMEIARCMLHEKELPKTFWAEAANTTVFLQNRLPTKALKDKTPFEAWYGYNPSLTFLKVFGCVCFVYIPQVKCDKLDKKATPGIFVGYSSVSKAYKVYHPQTEKMSMIKKNKTWELVDKPKNRKVIGVKWVFRTKLNADSSINKYKARLVVKGYAQIFGVDYSDTFAPVSRLDTIRLVLTIAAQKGWKIFQLDVKPAFLNGVLEEEIYVEQPEGFVKHGEEDKVYLLYGLKQAPRAWYSRINDHLLSIGFTKSLSEFTLYVKDKGNSFLIVSLYVDDLLVTGDDTKLIDEFKQEMMQAFEMTDLGLMTYFLGIEIKQGENEVFICQRKYAKEILRKFQMDECKVVSTPMNQKEKFIKEDGVDKVDEGYYRSLIGCLMYLTATRPDIIFVVSLLYRFMHCASEVHLRAAKRILRYVKGTLDYGVKFDKCTNFKLCGFSDSD